MVEEEVTKEVEDIKISPSDKKKEFQVQRWTKTLTTRKWWNHKEINRFNKTARSLNYWGELGECTINTSGQYLAKKIATICRLSGILNFKTRD